MLNLQPVTVTRDVLDRLYKHKRLEASELSLEPDDCYFVLKTEQGGSALGVLVGDTVHLVNPASKTYQGVEPKDAAQRCFFDALDRFSCVVALGLAGSGKTFMSVAYALHKMFREDKSIVMVKPTYFIGGKSNAIAAVKGDVREKLDPYVTSFTAHINKLMGDHGALFLDEWETSGKLEFAAVELVRGRHFENSIVIVDEAQNLSAHELLSLISRVADSSQLILLGDSQQIDTGVRWGETGLSQFIDSDAFWESKHAGGVRFTRTYRGVLAELASAVLYELNEVMSQ
jgi:predicted ribonuclease YlaK